MLKFRWKEYENLEVISGLLLSSDRGLGSVSGTPAHTVPTQYSSHTLGAACRFYFMNLPGIFSERLAYVSMVPF